MWARIIEVMLGCWLLVSPFVFRHPAADTFLWINDLAVGGVVITISLLGCWSRLGKIRLLNLVTSAYLYTIALALNWPPPPPGAYQNYIVVALLLLILAIIPTSSAVPPKPWLTFLEERSGPNASAQ